MAREVEAINRAERRILFAIDFEVLTAKAATVLFPRVICTTWRATQGGQLTSLAGVACCSHPPQVNLKHPYGPLSEIFMARHPAAPCHAVLQGTLPAFVTPLRLSPHLSPSTESRHRVTQYSPVVAQKLARVIDENLRVYAWNKCGERCAEPAVAQVPGSCCPLGAAKMLNAAIPWHCLSCPRSFLTLLCLQYSPADIAAAIMWYAARSRRVRFTA